MIGAWYSVQGGRSLKSQLKILSTTFFCRVGIPLPRETSVEALLRDNNAAASDDGLLKAKEPLAALDDKPAEPPAAVKTAVSAGRVAVSMYGREEEHSMCNKYRCQSALENFCWTTVLDYPDTFVQGAHAIIPDK